MARLKNIDSSAITAIIPTLAILPAWLVSISFIWWILSGVSAIPYLLFISIIACGAITMFLPIIQRVDIVRLLGTRPPTAFEQERLIPAVRLVASSARVPHHKFVLAVDESDEINAFACGGHILVVSSFALHQLSDAELTGVVAHELSHHLGAHTIALAIGQWLSLPVIACARIGFYLRFLATSAEVRLQNKSKMLIVAGRSLTILLTVISSVFQAALLSAELLNNLVGKDAEFQADTRAVTLGYGRELSAALGHISSPTGTTRHWHRHIFTSHPPARTRIARIDAQLRAGDRRR